MAEQSSQDKTEKATPRRREQAREDGRVAKSAELNSVAVLLSALMILSMMSDRISGLLTGFMRHVYLQASSIRITPDSLPTQALQVVKVIVAILGPVLLAVMILALFVNVAQVGIIFMPKSLMPKFNKLNPISGMKQFVSLKALVELAKGLLKIGIVAIITYSILIKYQEHYTYLTTRTVTQISAFLAMVLFEIGLKVGIALLIMAIADYAYQKWQYEKDLKMTKEEVKEEGKQHEGNPQIKGKIKQLQREVSMRRFAAEIPEATVVVTNPTHIAVALKYNPEISSDAPRIVAKGQRKVAEKIKKIAKEHHIPIIENKPLARSLFQSCEVGVEIPEEFYQAVAEILSQIYQADQERYDTIKDIIND